MNTRNTFTTAMAILGAAVSFSAAPAHAQMDATRQRMADQLMGEQFMRMKTMNEAYSNSTTMGAWGLASGANFNAEEKQKITPLVKGVPDGTGPLNEKIFELNRDLTAQTGNHKVIQLDFRDRQSELRDAEHDLAEAKKTGAETAGMAAEVERAKDEVESFRKGMEASLRQIGATSRQIQETEKRRDAIFGQSQGWVLSDSSEEKADAKSKKFNCANGERLVSQLGIGMNQYGCIGSDGYMTSKGTRVWGMENMNTDTKFTREDGGLKVVITGADGKPINERIVKAMEETTKSYGKDGKLATSCTLYGDEKTRNNPYGTALPGSISR